MGFRIGGFVAFVIYMITTYSLYVPNWSFSEHSDHGVKKYIVSNVPKVQCKMNSYILLLLNFNLTFSG